MPTRTLDMNRIKALAERLKGTRRLSSDAARRGVNPDEEAWQVATALSDIEESVTRLFGELVPKLLTVSPESDEADSVLNDVGEEYRHILYHIRDTKLFSYIFADE
jgi:hypothetical protein